MQTFSLRVLNKITKHLHLADKSVLVVKAGTDLAQVDNLRQLAALIEGMTPKVRVAIVVADDLGDLRLLDQDQMAKLGWFYIETLHKMVDKANAKLQSAGDDQRPLPASDQAVQLVV